MYQLGPWGQTQTLTRHPTCAIATRQPRMAPMPPNEPKRRGEERSHSRAIWKPCAVWLERI